MNNLEQTAKNLREICSHGLAKGVGVNKPGEMCVMQAVSIASSEPFTDKPTCVDYRLRELCVLLNDNYLWINNHERSQYLTPIAIASLGTRGRGDVTKMASRIFKEYEAKLNQFWAEYNENCNQYWDENNENHNQFCAEYNEKWKQFWAECNENCNQFWDEYNENCNQLSIETCTTLLAELIRLETPGSKFLYLLEGK